MDKFIKDKINQSINDRKQYHSLFFENCSTYNSFIELEKKAFEAGCLSRKYKGLMALSISIVTKCEPCIE
jgi:alkylhydroperoxidase/carboxymuconolactone decarboxylase family protein YurZ